MPQLPAPAFQLARDLYVQHVREPSTHALAAIGITALLAVRRCKALA